MARATAAKTTAVATTKKNMVGPAFDFSADQGAGFENADSQSYAIPFLAILQPLSPQCLKSDGAYVKGAEAGMFYNTVSAEVFDGEEEGVEAIPCSFMHTFVEWGQRDQGGGFIAEYDNVAGTALRSTAKRNDKNQDILPNGHVINDTRNHYVLIKDSEGHWQPVLMSLSSTQIKASRNWMSTMQRLCQQHNMPMFALRFRLTTKAQQNDKGSWYGLAVEHIGFVEDEETYEKAKGFYAQIKSGMVKASPRDSGGDGEGSGDRREPDDM